MALELPIAGMTCASCASRVERSLNEVVGVAATVNYATERATVDYDPDAVAIEELVGAVEAVGAWLDAGAAAVGLGSPLVGDALAPDGDLDGLAERARAVCAVVGARVR